MNIVDALAVYRVTRLFIWDGFPPVAKMRDDILQKLPRDSASYELAICPWCLSFWIALGMLSMKAIMPKTYRRLALPLALSAVTGLLSDSEDAVMRLRGIQ